MQTIIEKLLTDAVGSDVFAAGLALGAFGMALAVLGRTLQRAVALVRHRLCHRVALDSRGAAFRAFVAWMDETRVLAHVRNQRIALAGGEPMLTPGYGRHWFVRDRHLVILDLTMEEKVRVGSSHQPKLLERIELTLVGPRPGIVLDWIAAGQRRLDGASVRPPQVHVFLDGWWEQTGPLHKRALDTVICEDDAPQALLADLARFYDRRDWYAARGVPWRRGYLLHGPPGTGKSSLIRALASELGKDIALIDIGHPRLQDDQLREAMAKAPKGAVLVMEDIDAALSARIRGDGDAGISLSGLLNAIDGIAAQEGAPLFMTSNHPDRLEPALVRPGRADVHREIGLITGPTAARLFARFFPGCEAEAQTFAARIGEARLAPAAVQAWLLTNAEDVARAATAAGLVRPKAERIAAE